MRRALIIIRTILLALRCRLSHTKARLTKHQKLAFDILCLLRKAYSSHRPDFYIWSSYCPRCSWYVPYTKNQVYFLTSQKQVRQTSL